MRRRPISTLFGAGFASLRQSLIALTLLVVADSLAGVVLGESEDRLTELPGLLLLVPASTALRGNVFGAMGSRLGTAIHAGTFRPSLRPSSVVGRNVVGAMILTLAMSAALAAIAKVIAELFGVLDPISLSQFVVISIVGGLLSSVVVLVIAGAGV